MTIYQPHIKFIEEFDPLFIPDHPHYNTRFITYYGGRAGMKSWQVARAILCRMQRKKIRVLCTREYQNSIRDSVLSLLEDQAQQLGISDFFDFQKTTVIAANGSDIVFKGLKQNIGSVKGVEKIDLVWIEEGESVTAESLRTLIFTIRKSGSQIITTFNTGQDTDPVYEKFVTGAKDSPRHYTKLVTYLDNPFASQETLDDAEEMKLLDYEGYCHEWLGHTWTRSDAQVLNGKWKAGECDITDADGPYFGSDFGYSADPATLIKFYIIGKILYISDEAYKTGVELDDYAGTDEEDGFYDQVPESRDYLIRADSARPDIISHIKKTQFEEKEPFRIVGAKKWKGSVEAGIAWLRSFEKIIINPQCVNTLKEARLWKYKTDRLTGDVLPVLIDANNHSWDAIRYGGQPMIKPVKEPQMRTT